MPVRFFSHHDSSCYFCLSSIKEDLSILCETCFCTAQQYRIEFCARCGIKNCVECNNLSVFSNVESLYSYNKLFSYVLDLAKNKYNTNVQKLFFDLYFIVVKRFFVRKLNEKKYSHIILSPLRKERIFFSSWHVNLFYEEVFSYIIQNNLVGYDFNLLSPHFVYKKKKQGLMSFEKRLSVHSNVKKNKIYISYLSMYNETINNQNILLLDDVLTTGKTAVFSKELCAPYFNNCSWDLFSLFRTPQKGLLSK